MLPEESAISGEFTAALSLSWGLSNQEQIRALERPFSKAWIKSWDEIAETKGWVLAGTNLAEMPGYKRKTPEMFPGASGRFRRFKVDDGLEFLKILTAKGANPNLILSLLIKYLWNDDVSRTEHSSLRIKELRKQLEAVQKTKGLYLLILV